MKDLHLHKFCKFSVFLKFLPICCQYLKVELASVFSFGCSCCFVILTSVSVLLFWRYGNWGTWVGVCCCNLWLWLVALLCWFYVWLGLTGELSHLLKNQTNRKEWSCMFLYLHDFFESIWLMESSGVSGHLIWLLSVVTCCLFFQAINFQCWDTFISFQDALIEIKELHPPLTILGGIFF